MSATCQGGCRPACHGCADADMACLWRNEDRAEPLPRLEEFDALAILVDGKIDGVGERMWAVGIYHPQSGARRYACGARDLLPRGAGWAGPNLQARAEWLAV